MGCLSRRLIPIYEVMDADCVGWNQKSARVSIHGQMNSVKRPERLVWNGTVRLDIWIVMLERVVWLKCVKILSFVKK